ncbi:N-acetylmuramoyl-L-alanine amidase [Gracilibacillus sp. S3-1-1]|uniref:N-acetylmuramoyl-L-alanine amidase n=1 Tax=Gracilibacillus pellucidus TaxID=3095368 RepID=A0ACC6M6C4_9BACI|nr:N-acetylmuramoyl-L-alanine amidase [Gracilibacillus sp. S3-1-1]MDX8046475.1 N-acetylmuramoyl-L-alanine amidase [Gracilibacillus sp. S3-1-1]
MNNRLMFKGLFFFAILFLSFAFFQPVKASNLETYEVSTPILNVRSVPSADGEVLGQLVKGSTLMVFDEKYGWVQTYYAGKEVWVAKHHLLPIGDSSSAVSTNESKKTITIASDSVNIRSGPGTDYALSGSAVSGDSFKVVDESGDWYEINLNGSETGWVAAWLTDQAPQGNSSQATSTTTSEQSLAGYNIVIDPGHGGKDPGAIGFNGVQEKDVILPTAEKVVNSLRNAGANVIVTRSGDYFVQLEDRSSISNSYYTHAFISLHYDSSINSSVSGLTAYVADFNDRNLAESVKSSILSHVNLNDRGVRQANYKVLVNTTAPSILLELGYMTNPGDLAIAQSDSYQNSVAQGITEGLINYFN